MGRGIIVVWFKPKATAPQNGATLLAEALKKSLEGVQWIRNFEASDDVASDKPYRQELLVQVADIEAVNATSLTSQQPSEIDSAEYILFKEISKDLRASLSDDETPPSGSISIQVGMDPTDESVDDYHNWFNTQHLAHLQEVPGWRSGSRYALHSHHGSKQEEVQPFMSMNEYDKENGLGGAIWRVSVENPWSKKVLANLKRPIHRRAFASSPFEAAYP